MIGGYFYLFFEIFFLVFSYHPSVANERSNGALSTVLVQVPIQPRAKGSRMRKRPSAGDLEGSEGRKMTRPTRVTARLRESAPPYQRPQPRGSWGGGDAGGGGGGPHG